MKAHEGGRPPWPLPHGGGVVPPALAERAVFPDLEAESAGQELRRHIGQCGVDADWDSRDRDTAWEVPDAAIVLRLVVGESDSLVAAANVRLPRLTAVVGSTVSSAADAPRPRRRAVTTALSTTLVGQPEASNRGSALPEASGGHILSRRINRAVGKRLLIWTAQRQVTPLHFQAPNRPVGTQHAAPVCTCLERECIDEMDY